MRTFLNNICIILVLSRHYRNVIFERLKVRSVIFTVRNPCVILVEGFTVSIIPALWRNGGFRGVFLAVTWRNDQPIRTRGCVYIFK